MAHCFNTFFKKFFFRMSNVVEQKYVAKEQYFVINQLWESDEWKEAFERMFEQHDLCDIVMEEFEAKVKMEAGGSSMCLFFVKTIGFDYRWVLYTVSQLRKSFSRRNT